MYDDIAMIGDKVYIGGLYGDDYNLVNNKVGILRKMYNITSNKTVNYLGEIDMGMVRIPINLKFVYKLNSDIISSKLLSEDIVSEMFFEHNIKTAIAAIDDATHHQVALCDTNDNHKISLIISTLN